MVEYSSEVMVMWLSGRQVSEYIQIYQSARSWWFGWMYTESPESSTGVVQALRVVRSPQFYAVLEVSWKRVLMQLESRTQTTDRRTERMEGGMRAMMGLLQTFIGSPQMTRVSIGFIYLVDATHKKHPIPMNMASSFEVHFYAWCTSWDHPDHNI